MTRLLLNRYRGTSLRSLTVAMQKEKKKDSMRNDRVTDETLSSMRIQVSSKANTDHD
jgi:hypothetical protein